jgi:hypothetical protein
MATKPSSARNNKKKTKSKAVVGGQSRLSRRPLMLVTALLFGAVGVYLLAQSGAMQPEEVQLADDPARGLLYEGKKVKAKGPCKGGFDLTTPEDEQIDGKDKRRCAHIDPAPKGLDIRERIKKVDQNLVALADHDSKNPPIKSTDMSGAEQVPYDIAATVNGWSMDGVGARDWACTGTGKDGARIQFVYVHSASASNRLGDLRPGFNAIARRMNSIYFQSGYESGNGHQIRFATSEGDGCNLAIAVVSVPSSYMDDTYAIRAKVREAGLMGFPKAIDLNGDGKVDTTTYVDRKYIMMIDRDVAGKCGLGEVRSDDSAAQTNVNNHSVTYSWIWKGCWNYAEPHELMHMLGGVQTSAPRATEGRHCYDERDIMCYDDDGSGGVYMRNVCTRNIDLWRLDCNHNDYYRGANPSSGYLSNHWNTANSRFLYR